MDTPYLGFHLLLILEERIMNVINLCIKLIQVPFFSNTSSNHSFLSNPYPFITFSIIESFMSLRVSCSGGRLIFFPIN